MIIDRLNFKSLEIIHKLSEIIEFDDLMFILKTLDDEEYPNEKLEKIYFILSRKRA